ncbi:hypothetical protein PI125_g1997 [Phytophthora idaei]|nr:hypothetical protein PI125_g1997 [Phytophthora idaei]
MELDSGAVDCGRRGELKSEFAEVDHSVIDLDN